MLKLHFVDYQNNESALSGALKWKPICPREHLAKEARVFVSILRR